MKADEMERQFSLLLCYLIVQFWNGKRQQFFVVVAWGFLDIHAQRETHLWDSRATGIRSKHSDQGDCQESKTQSPHNVQKIV